uniref:PIR Superfamily Protein n=1 Tax=Strongyloides papillosus TaxID=174720 RepID=A0A0N5CC70_STREA
MFDEKKRKTSFETPYKYTQYLTNYCRKFTKDNYNFNKIIMNEVDYVNKLSDNFSDILKQTNYSLLRPSKKDKNTNNIYHGYSLRR